MQAAADPDNSGSFITKRNLPGWSSCVHGLIVVIASPRSTVSQRSLAASREMMQQQIANLLC